MKAVMIVYMAFWGAVAVGTRIVERRRQWKKKMR
jgi:hypothetical protein